MNRGMRTRRFLDWTLLLGALLAISALPAIGQIDRGAIEGRVLDSSGGAVPNAIVTVTNKSTGVVITTPVNQPGGYQVLALIPGTYSVKVSADGFGSVLHDDIDLHVQDRLSIDFTLKVGSVKQEVVVTAGEPLLQTQSADVGSVVDEQHINDLPLNGRRYADLALLEPGVQKFYAANNPAPDRFSVNGNLELQNNFLLNGVDNNSWSENLQEFSVQVVQPPPDAVQEFRVQTRTYSTEFGNSAGAVINATIKSGTNAYHGNLFEYLRNAVLDANSWINNAQQPKQPHGGFTQNQSGIQGQDLFLWRFRTLHQPAIHLCHQYGAHAADEGGEFHRIALRFEQFIRPRAVRLLCRQYHPVNRHGRPDLPRSRWGQADDFAPRS